MTDDLIRVEDLRLHLGGRPVLDIPEFSVREGEVLALIGPNGSGKSSLIQALALLRPTRMEYWFAGRKVALPQEGLILRRQMAVVFQQPLLLDARVFDNVALGLRLRRVPRRRIEARVGLWLEKLGVQNLAGRRARELSGGEAQRVSLARALVLEPRLLFLDEPFAALDLLAREPLIRDLRGLLKESGVTAVFATHDFLEVLLLADRVAVLEEGRVVQSGPPAELFRQPADPVVRNLVRAAEEMVRVLLDDEESPGPGRSSSD